MLRQKVTLFASLATLSIVAMSPALAAPVVDWISINNMGVASGVVTSGDTNSPTVTGGDGIQIIGGFPTITIADGEFIRLSGSLTLVDRLDNLTLTDQVRFGLFRSDDDANPIQGTALSGIILEHRDQIRELRLNTQLAPFNSGTQSFGIGTTSGDPEMSTPPSGSPVTLQFTLEIARDGENMNINGTFSDSLDFTEHFTRADYDSPMAVDVFRWNRAGFLIGGNVNQASVSFSAVEVVTGVAVSLPGDFDDNGVVDAADLAVWKESFGGPGADANGDNITDGSDFLIWQRNFMQPAAQAAVAAIPEPATATLLAAAGSMGASCFRRRRLSL